jgi:fatty acid desaturase
MKCSIRKKFSPEINARLCEFMGLDNHHAAAAVVLDFAIIAGAMSLYFVSPWFIPLTLLIVGSRQRALLTLLHESAHGVLARSKKWNFVCGTFLSGYLVFQAYFRYQESHVRLHHGSLGDPSVDPDTASYVNQGLFGKNYSKRAFLKHLFKKIVLVDFFSYMHFLFRERLFPRNWRSCSRKQKIEYAVFTIYWMAILTALAMADALQYFVLLWVVPYLTVAQIIGWLIELAEHYPLAAYSDHDLHVTRNRQSGPIEWFLTGAHSEQYHLTHHLRPKIPFWNMTKAHRLMLDDDEYRQANAYSSGIFSSPHESMPTIIEEIFHSLPSFQRTRWTSGRAL